MATVVRVRKNKLVTPRTFLVELSEGEADYILGTTNYIGGDHDNSPRKYAERLRRDLTGKLGYTVDETDFAMYAELAEEVGSLPLAPQTVVVASFGS